MSETVDAEMRIEAAAAVLGVSLPPESLAGVAFDFDRLRAMAELLMKHSLSATDEALPVFRHE